MFAQLSRGGRFVWAVVAMVVGNAAIAAAPVTTVPQVTFNPAGFSMRGNPESQNGATWTYTSTDDGVYYEISGVLFKPAKAGLLPAVVISHGQSQTAAEYGKDRAQVMVNWGLVSIATNYTFAGANSNYSVRKGSPGAALADSNNSNLYEENALRANKALLILRSLSYVDKSRIAAFGHSRGAFVTEVQAARFPSTLKAAAQTGGGLSADPNNPYPNVAYAPYIQSPYSSHHGVACTEAEMAALAGQTGLSTLGDTAVSPARDQDLHALLAQAGVVHQLKEYKCFTHAKTGTDTGVFSDIKIWFTNNGLITP